MKRTRYAGLIGEGLEKNRMCATFIKVIVLYDARGGGGGGGGGGGQELVS